MSGTLFVVATPIGNLEDITLRALRVLREADVVAAEDTRRTSKLLAHYAIRTPQISFHEHNTRSRLPQLMARLESGAKIALVTDAGTPGVSDPGVELVRAALERDIVVDVIPGPNAALTAAVASGFVLEPLTIFGFPPVKGTARKRWLAEAAATPHAFSFFESPHRVQRTVAELAEHLGNRPIAIGRELTKAHQEFRVGLASTLVGHLTDPRGEYTLVVAPAAEDRAPDHRSNDQQIALEFGELAKTTGSGRRSVINALARKHGRPPREIYGIIEKAKTSGS